MAPDDRDDRDDRDEGDKALREALTAAAAPNGAGRYRLRLFLAGMGRRSVAALENLRRICEEHLPGRYELEVIDILQEPHRASEADLVAAPTLVKDLPLPLRKLLGDMSDTERVLVGLGISRE